MNSPKWNETAVTRRLGLSHPIIQGPFGGGISTVRLLAAVSEAGGLGSYGAHNLSPGEIRDLAAEIRRATSRPFALNLWVSDHDPGGLEMRRDRFAENLSLFQPFYEKLGVKPPEFPAHPGPRFAEQMEAVLEARPPVFSFVFGIPPAEILAECHQRGIVTLGAATTVSEALALEAAGVDLVLATGFEAGGHRPSFLRPAEESLMGTMALVPQVVDRVKIPVIAAGGIADGRGIAAALTLGAGAVQLGTAFLACEESGASALHRAQLFSAAAEDTALSRAFSGRLARFIRNEFIRTMEGRQQTILPFPQQGWFTSFIKQAATEQGNRELMALYSGQGAPLLRHRKAGELMSQLIADTDRILRQDGRDEGNSPGGGG